MRTLTVIAALIVLACAGRAYALGIDVGPVHIHGGKVKIGNTIELTIKTDRIVKDEKDAERITAIKGVRVGSDEKFDIKVAKSDLDDKSKDLLKEIKEDKVYKMKLEKLDEGWKLLKLRHDD
jgi:hypothetical protein